jgi:hypothetical protein
VDSLPALPKFIVPSTTFKADLVLLVSAILTWVVGSVCVVVVVAILVKLVLLVSTFNFHS